jgi:hypothetical protein
MLPLASRLDRTSGMTGALFSASAALSNALAQRFLERLPAVAPGRPSA